MNPNLCPRILISLIILVLLEVSFALPAQTVHPEDSLRTGNQLSNPPALIDIKKQIIRGNLQDAEGLLLQYIDRYPSDPVACFELAKILAAKNDFSGAAVYAAKAAELDPSNSWYTVFLAETYQLTGRYDDALLIYEEIVASDPGNLDHSYKLAALCLGLGKYDRALEVYDMIEKQTGISEDLSLQKQQIYLQLKEYRKAEEEIKQLVEANPSESRYYGILAEFYMARKMNREALEQYQKILEVDPDNAYIHMTLADFYRKEGDREKSYAELKKGFANPNLDVDTKVNILLSFYTINEIVTDLKEEAFELARLLTETHPDDPKVYAIYGDLLTQDRQFEEARGAFLQVLARDSSRYIIWEELLRMDLLISDYSHLAAYGHLALELFPEQPVLYLFTALGEFQLKHYQEAERLLSLGVKMVAGNNELLAQFYMYLGDTYHALEQAEASDNAYEKSLQFNDSNAYVLNNYSYYLSLRGMDLEKAESMAKKAVTLDPLNTSFQDTYGWVLYQLGQYEEAKKWIGKSLEDKENVTGEVLEHYGDVLFRLGEIKEAQKYWKQAKEKGGGSAILEQKIVRGKLTDE